jgi:hypothetical protein
MLVTGGVTVARNDGAVAEEGDSPTRQEEEQVPQPLCVSLSLRNTWLLPGVLES